MELAISHTRKGGYHASPSQDSLTQFRFEWRNIEKILFHEVTNLIHEVASGGQIEINFMHNTLTKATMMSRFTKMSFEIQQNNTIK